MLEEIAGWGWEVREGRRLGAFGKDERRVSANFCVSGVLIRFVLDKEARLDWFLHMQHRSIYVLYHYFFQVGQADIRLVSSSECTYPWLFTGYDDACHVTEITTRTRMDLRQARR